MCQAAPNELAVHALHVVSLLKPVLCVFSGHIVHWSLLYTYPGWHTHAEGLGREVTRDLVERSRDARGGFRSRGHVKRSPQSKRATVPVARLLCGERVRARRAVVVARQRLVGAD